jgi:hypothetical protein
VQVDQDKAEFIGWLSDFSTQLFKGTQGGINKNVFLNHILLCANIFVGGKNEIHFVLSMLNCCCIYYRGLGAVASVQPPSKLCLWCKLTTNRLTYALFALITTAKIYFLNNYFFHLGLMHFG